MTWYNSIGQGMGDTLLFANEKKGYTLADRGTYLAMQDKLPNLTVIVGGNNLAENKDKALLNPYGVLAVDPVKHPGVNSDLAGKFVTWITLGGDAEGHRRLRRGQVRPAALLRRLGRVQALPGRAGRPHGGDHRRRRQHATEPVHEFAQDPEGGDAEGRAPEEGHDGL